MKLTEHDLRQLRSSLAVESRSALDALIADAQTWGFGDTDDCDEPSDARAIERAALQLGVEEYRP